MLEWMGFNIKGFVEIVCRLRLFLGEDIGDGAVEVIPSSCISLALSFTRFSVVMVVKQLNIH